MAITNYTDLQTSIADFLNRDDLTSIIPTFIRLAEEDMNLRLRHWRMEARSTATINAQYSALPIDFIEAVRFMIVGGDPKALTLISQGELAKQREANNDSAGTPRFYAITDGAIETFPKPDGDYTLELVYYADIPPLNSQNLVNFVVQQYPSLYLYGSLLHSAPYLKDDERLPIWASLYQQSLDKVNLEGQQAIYGGQGRKIQIRSYG